MELDLLTRLQIQYSKLSILIMFFYSLNHQFFLNYAYFYIIFKSVTRYIIFYGLFSFSYVIMHATKHEKGSYFMNDGYKD